MKLKKNIAIHKITSFFLMLNDYIYSNDDSKD